MKTPKAVLTRETLENQTKAFLEAGGKIQYIKPGATGRKEKPGPVHIKLDKSKS